MTQSHKKVLKTDQERMTEKYS